MRTQLRAAIGLCAAAMIGAGAVVVIAEPFASAASVAGAAQPSLAPRDSVGVEHPVVKSELHFVAIAPCRIADTRAAGGALGSAGTRTFQVSGTSGFSSQGGTSAGCTVPTGAKSVALTITALSPQGTGAITAYPAGGARPLARSLSVNKGLADTASTDLALGTGGKVSMYNTANGSVHLLLDVNGYYTEQISALVYTGSSAYIYSGSGRMLSVHYVSTGKITITLDRDVSYCTAFATAYYPNVYASAEAGNGNVVTLWTWALDSTTHKETPSDTFAGITVTC